MNRKQWHGHSEIANKGRRDQNDKYYPSHRLQFYRDKAQSLIGKNKVKWYINWVFEYLKFTDQKHEEFVTQIMRACTFTMHDGTTYISDMVLSNYLYQFDMDLTLKHNYLSPKSSTSRTILLSDLSQYLFCPASFALNQTFNIPTHKPIDSSSKWLGNKDGFYDRYNRYQIDKDLKACFEYDSSGHESITSIIKEDKLFNVFEELFRATITVNNYYDTAPKTFVSDEAKLTGAPDYILKLSNGKTVIIAEKFSAAGSAGVQKVYNSDIIDLEAYLIEFTHLKIDYAYFINWNWSVNRESGAGERPATNLLYVSRVNVHKIELSEAREKLIDETTARIAALNSGEDFDFADLGFANKCRNCSVYSYCEHKSGVKKKLSIPYGS